jgi:DNA-directed RNA polymerase subunit RPC12/RpoP
MKITVTYSCPSCGYRYTETIDIDARKKTRACQSCGEPEILVLDPMPEKLVYAT